MIGCSQALPHNIVQYVAQTLGQPGNQADLRHNVAT